MKKLLITELSKLESEITKRIRRAQGYLHNLRTGLQAGEIGNKEAVEFIQEVEHELSEISD